MFPTGVGTGELSWGIVKTKTQTPLSEAARLLDAGNVVVLTGAGISTDSGIPDYRGPDGVRRRVNPMTYAEFTKSEAARRRYWARSHLGWPLIRSALPNSSHAAVAAWEAHGLLAGVITQNVDRLHQRAGSTRITDLHGRLDRVRCLGCGNNSARETLEDRFSEANPGLAKLADEVRQVNPDGDVELESETIDSFVVVDCHRCGGVLKPDVVYFGESVPKDRVQRCLDAVERASALVVLGSSLTVMSGYRFVRLAHRQGLPIVIINSGHTRGDGEATVRVDAPLGSSLERVNTILGLGGQAS